MSIVYVTFGPVRRKIYVFKTRARGAEAEESSVPGENPEKFDPKRAFCVCTEKKAVTNFSLKALKTHSFPSHVRDDLCVWVCSFVGVKFECKNAEAYKKNI